MYIQYYAGYVQRITICKGNLFDNVHQTISDNRFANSKVVEEFGKNSHKVNISSKAGLDNGFTMILDMNNNLKSSGSVKSISNTFKIAVFPQVNSEIVYMNLSNNE